MANDDITILAIDDEPALLRLLRLHLEEDGFRVVCADNGHDGLALWERERPDLVLLDLRLPELDGFETLARLRAQSDVPVILVTVMYGDQDKIRGLNMGADDYLTKPFNLDELSARIRAVLRRTRVRRNGVRPLLRDFGDLQVDIERHRAVVFGRDVRLSPTEWTLLLQLSAESGQVVRHDELLPTLGASDPETHIDHVRVWISRLRRKLGDDSRNPHLIRAVQGVGYQLIDNTRRDDLPSPPRELCGTAVGSDDQDPVAT